jgi:hypothetical protein
MELKSSVPSLFLHVGKDLGFFPIQMSYPVPLLLTGNNCLVSAFFFKSVNNGHKKTHLGHGNRIQIATNIKEKHWFLTKKILESNFLHIIFLQAAGMKGTCRFIRDSGSSEGC